MITVKKSMFKPGQLALVKTENSKRPRVVEVISHPIPEGPIEKTEHGERMKVETIKIRWVPGDPCTLGEVAVADLQPSRHGKRAYIHVAEVRGQFSFPEDMLRYDGAALYRHDLHEEGEPSPNKGTDYEPHYFGARRGLCISEETDVDLGHPCDEDPYVRQPRVLVYAVTDRKSPPWTVARWQSFGVTIKHLSTKKLGD